MTVGIVGLGIAGLRTAMLLKKAGVQVRLFEARHRVGGRLHTVDEGGGCVYEAGGEWIDADHVRCLELLREMGVQPLDPAEWPQRVIYQGKWVTQANLWTDALEDDVRVEAIARELCRDLGRPPWRNSGKRNLDERTLGDFLREHTQSERGLWYVTAKYRSDEGEDPDKVGLLGWLAGYSNYLDREGDVMSAHRVSGGFGRLCEEMLRATGETPTYGAALKRVGEKDGEVSLEFDGFSDTVDRVVLTLPPSALERVCFEPALPVEKRCAIEGCRMGRAIKIVWEFESAWWEAMDWGGGMLCDGPLQQTWAQAGEAPLLCAYVCGDQAMKWVACGDPVNAGLYELAKLFPQAAKQFKRGWSHLWPTDPWARGGFSHLAPGYVLEHMEHIAPPVGRIHFAGEHTALWTGFIEGALESAERVAAEILPRRERA